MLLVLDTLWDLKLVKKMVGRQGAARVIVADLSEARLSASQSFGADVVINASKDSLTAAVKDLTNGKGADYVVEAVGRKETLLQSIDLVRADGGLFWFGLPDTTALVDFNFRDFFRKRLAAHSTYGAQGETGLVSFRIALDWITGKQINVSPLLSHILSIEEIGKAFDLADSRDDDAMKVSVSF